MKERDQPERHALLPLVDAGYLSSVLGKPVVRDGRKAVVSEDSALQALEVDQKDICGAVPPEDCTKISKWIPYLSCSSST